MGAGEGCSVADTRALRAGTWPGAFIALIVALVASVGHLDRWARMACTALPSPLMDAGTTHRGPSRGCLRICCAWAHTPNRGPPPQAVVVLGPAVPDTDRRIGRGQGNRRSRATPLPSCSPTKHSGTRCGVRWAGGTSCLGPHGWVLQCAVYCVLKFLLLHSAVWLYTGLSAALRLRP